MLHVIIEICKVIQHTYGINHITNKFHRNKLEFTDEFIGNFHGKIKENFWQPPNNPPSHDKQEHLCHLLDTIDTSSPKNAPCEHNVKFLNSSDIEDLKKTLLLWIKKTIIYMGYQKCFHRTGYRAAVLYLPCNLKQFSSLATCITWTVHFYLLKPSLKSWE